jgi:hypothetical protein
MFLLFVECLNSSLILFLDAEVCDTIITGFVTNQLARVVCSTWMDIIGRGETPLTIPGHGWVLVILRSRRPPA